MKYLTDYPVAGNPAQDWIEVELLAYDRDRYVSIKYNGVIEEIKAGYIRKRLKPTADLRTLSAYELYKLPYQVGGKAPTERQVARELKARHSRATTYHVTIYDRHGEGKNVVRKFRTRLQAIKALCGLGQQPGRSEIHANLHMTCHRGNGFLSIALLQVVGHAIHEVSAYGSRKDVGYISRAQYKMLHKAICC